MCDDDRFELIEKYKKELIESTNIETRPEEMKVLDSILFRFWQMGWLDAISSAEQKKAQLSKEDATKDTISISRRSAIEAIESIDVLDGYQDKMDLIDMVKKIPPGRPDNQVHLCDSCKYDYPNCPSESDDVIFGNGIGNDNICACNKYKPSSQPDLGKYEYHYDHTDCIWYRPEARNRCPVTCAQYRDGWNDAMNYIFRDGKGYRPYRRGKQYDK